MTFKSASMRAGVSALIALVLGAGVVSAASSGAEISTSPVSWTILGATCDDLDSGAVINGEGTLKSVTTVRTNHDGTTTVVNSTHAFGIATDEDGNVYMWSYSNQFRISNTLADPDTRSGTMTDHFSLAGKGPARIVAGFIAEYTEGPGGFSIVPSHVVGDPLDFAAGTARCDPI
jgi:hypothetical protein